MVSSCVIEIENAHFELMVFIRCSAARVWPVRLPGGAGTIGGSAITTDGGPGSGVCDGGRV